ncbi:uncharacterized protein LOC142338640 [Convolutriloba macropyga]|uniref:uncharacterized protein LOC142338640 n=1 Tax=Convolutriloba macropyga TaxID=536237 RepID=UPI003F51D579
MGACCPKLSKSQSCVSMAESDAPLLSGGMGGSAASGVGGRQLPNGTLDSQSRDADEKAIYTKIIDDTQTQIIDVMSIDQRGGNVSELVDRASLYQSRLQSLASRENSKQHFTPSPENNKMPPKMALCTEGDFKMLPRVSSQEVLLMNEILTQFEEAYIEIRVKHTEPLIAPLEI